MNFKQLDLLKNSLIDWNVNYSVYPYNGYTINEVLCQFFDAINKGIITINNYTEVVDNLVKWVKEEGLTQEVKAFIDKMLKDGTFESLINNELFENFRREFNTELLKVATQVDKNKNEIMGVFENVNSKFKGSSVYLPYNEIYGSYDDIISKLKAVNCNSISICPILFMNNKTDDYITGFKNNYELQEIVNKCRIAKSNGLKVLLKPHVSGNDISSHGDITPSNTVNWIASYSSYVKRIVKACSEYVDIISISNELKGQTNGNKSLWLTLIDDIRLMGDFIIISSNTIGELETNCFNEYTDMIGVNIYTGFKGGINKDIMLQEKDIFDDGKVNKMLEFSNKIGKKIIVTEVGVLPFIESLANPEKWGDTSNWTPSNEVQKRYYYLTVKNYLRGNNIQGVFIWNSCDGYTFLNKPSEEIIKKIYGGDIYE